MQSDKGGDLPPYTPLASPPLPWQKPRPVIRRRRALKFLGLGCLGFIAYAQWQQLGTTKSPYTSSHLSIQQLENDLAVCARLRSSPTDPIGPGRDKNARYIDGHKPTLIKNATIWTGEPLKQVSDEDAKKGRGFSWIQGDVLLENGLIKDVRHEFDHDLLSPNTLVWDAEGRQLTSGIIDMHSHAGVYGLPELWGSSDGNEMSSDITPYARSIDGLNPLDYQIQVIKSGGVTTSLVLPGSGNNIGGEAYVIKHAVGNADGRNETSTADMLADPDKNWRYLKMACGENAKGIYGKVGEHGPVSRMGESWEFRHAFEQAAKLVREQNDWCDAAESGGIHSMGSYLPQEIEWETLGAVLRGQVHVNVHCYTIPDLEAMVDHTNEFQFPVRAFHHAHQTYLVPEILKRTYGGSPPASALFADNMWYKTEAYIGSEFAGKILYENDLTPIYVSDNPVINAQHVVFEAAKAHGYGLPYHVAMASVTTAPAERLGLGNRLGKVKSGYDADIVVWDSDPMSVGATPVQVWIDGTAQFDDPYTYKKPIKAPTKPGGEERPETVLADDPTTLENVIFTGISRSFLSSVSSSSTEEPLLSPDSEENSQNLTLIVLASKVHCLGACAAELASILSSSSSSSSSSSPIPVIHLDDNDNSAKFYLTRPFVAFDSTLGLNAIDSETVTETGASSSSSSSSFLRGLDGLAPGTKKLRYAYRYGVTRAVSAPKGQGGSGLEREGTSVGFRTDAEVGDILNGGKGVFVQDGALHYSLLKGDDEGGSKGESLAGMVGELRVKLMGALGSVSASGEDKKAAGAYTEDLFWEKAVSGEIPLAVAVHSADGIAGLLRVVDEVEGVKAGVKAENLSRMRVILVGGAESHLLAKELSEASFVEGVVLAPFKSYRVSWEERRALVGAPLQEGTAVDALVKAGVTVGIGLEEDWVVRDLGLFAGTAWKNGGGELSEQEALELVGGNLIKMLGLEEEKDEGDEFVLFEGNPLEVGAKVRAVASGLGKVSVWEEVKN